MTAATTSPHALLSDIARDPGPWAQVFLDVSVDTADPPSVVEQRAASVNDELTRAGAPQADVDAGRSVPCPICRRCWRCSPLASR